MDAMTFGKTMGAGVRWSLIGSFASAGRAALICLILLAGFMSATASFAQSSVRPPENATTNQVPAGSPDGVLLEGSPPGQALGGLSDSDLWRAAKEGGNFFTSLPNDMMATLIRPGGENWRLLRNGPLFDWFGIAILLTIALLAIFLALRGRLRVSSGLSGVKIKRFSFPERLVHWMTASAFIILALTGLNISFGRELILPLIGHEIYGPASAFLKSIHNFTGFVFFAGVIIEFLMWVVHNIPNKYDIIWVARGGGMFGMHAPAKKFNAGQKAIFWITTIGGISLFISGWALMNPYTTDFFGATLGFLSSIGLDLASWIGLPPPPYSAVDEQLYNTIWHAGVAVFMVCVILAHIYIGTVGMQGAADAMIDGEVDLNWAREHHDKWVEELADDRGRVRSTGTGSAVPAE